MDVIIAEAEVFTKNYSAKAICPSGASTGTFEAFEKRDSNNKKYLGKSVLNAVNLINTKISKNLNRWRSIESIKITELNNRSLKGEIINI